MSTYGGDSWAPEAQYRKRRVDELITEEIPDDEALRTSSGRFACLVCPQCPVLDTVSMLHVHRRGARHRAAAEKQLVKKQRLHNEIQKRIALGKMAGPTASTLDERRHAALFTATKESKAKTLCNNLLPENQLSSQLKEPASPHIARRNSTPEASPSQNKGVAKKNCGNNEPLNRKQAEVVTNQNVQQGVQDERKRRQQELRLLESGWKRDGNDGWYMDENVEFDSDEEKPDFPL